MSSLWTPDGERPVGRDDPRAAPGPGTPPPSQTAQPAQPAGQPAGQAPPSGREPTEEEVRAHMEALRQQLASTPAAVVVANHAFGLFELAALHLSQQPPTLEEARLAIDALGTIVEGLAGRLGEAEEQLVDGLAQLRIAFVQISAAVQAGGPGGPGGAAPAG